MNIFKRKQKTIQDYYDNIQKAMRDFEKATKSKCQFSLLVVDHEERLLNDFNYKQIAFSDIVIDVLDMNTINVIKSRYFNNGIFVRERSK
jgi:hypothetical protein